MPVTPFHFGPGVAVHALAPRRVSFLAFCAANVIIDLESLYNLVQGNFPVHTFFHTYVGATLAIGVTAAMFLGAQVLGQRWALPNLLGWRDLSRTQIVWGAALGGYSHVLLDSVMHSDMKPFWPVSEANVLLRVVPLGVLHLGCVLAGLLGAGVLIIRRLRSTSR